MDAAAALASALRPGMRVAIGDGAGAPIGLAGPITEAAEAVGGVSLFLGWCLDSPVDYRKSAFTEIRAIMGGSALRRPIREGAVTYVPVRYSALPSLLAGPLRIDVLVTSLVPCSDGLAFSTEVGWQHAAVASGARVFAEVNHALPRAAAVPALPRERVTVIAEGERPAIELHSAKPDAQIKALASRVSSLIPGGSTLQVAPGTVGEAVLDALSEPVRIHSGVVGDAVVRLDQRGLLIGTPCASYVVGSQVYEWADEKAIAAPIERSHMSIIDDFFAVNTGFEIDNISNVNAQGFGGDVIGGLGGLPDFAAAAARAPRGRSIVAILRSHGGRKTLVHELGAPVTVPRCDIDMVVTECGVADLRGRSDGERAAVLHDLWKAA